MITPDGSKALSTNKSAATRMQNIQAGAKRASMPMNQAAQQSLRAKGSGGKPAGPPVGNNRPIQGLEPTNTGPVTLPTGGPQMAESESANFDPAVFKDSMVNELVGTIRTEQFLNSAKVKDAATSVRLKNFFNNTNPNRVPESRNLLTQIMHRMKMGPSNGS